MFRQKRIVGKQYKRWLCNAGGTPIDYTGCGFPAVLHTDFKATMFLAATNSLSVKFGEVENIKKAGILIFALGIMGLAIQQMFYAGLKQKALKAKNAAPGCTVRMGNPFIKPAVDFHLYCILSVKKI